MHLPEHYQDSEHEVYAHMTPTEVHELSRLQGGMMRDPHTNLPTFSKLWEHMHQPAVYEKIVDWGRRGFSGGGEVEGLNNVLRKSGQYGDTEYVKLPRPLASLFDYALNGGNPSINKNTGRRQYWLGGLLGGLGKIVSPFVNTVKSVASPIFNAFKPVIGTALQAAGPALGQMAQEGGAALGDRFGNPMLGSMMGSSLGNAVNSVASEVGNNLYHGGDANMSESLRNGAAAGLQTAAPSALNAANFHAAQMQNPLARFATHLSGGLAHTGLNNMASHMQTRTAPNYFGDSLHTTGDYFNRFGNNSPILQATGNAFHNLGNQQIQGVPMLGAGGAGYPPLNA